MPERFRGELLTMGRCTNPASFTFYLLLAIGFHSANFGLPWPFELCRGTRQ